MNTPSHVLIGCAAVGSRPARRFWPALLGGALPDTPIYLFYAYENLHHDDAHRQFFPLSD